MKTTIKTMFAAAVVMLSACQKEDVSTPSNFPADGVIRVATNVEGLKTRAGATTNNLTVLGLCVTNSSNATYSYSNKQVTKSGGVWSSADMMLWQNSTQAVDIVAYTPYQSAVEYTTVTTDAAMNVQADQSAADESGMIASDFLGGTQIGIHTQHKPECEWQDRPCVGAPDEQSKHHPHAGYGVQHYSGNRH